MIGTFKNSDFFVRTRKYRTQSRSVYNIHEDLSTMLTLSWRKKCIFRGAIEIIDSIFGQYPEQISEGGNEP